MGITVTTDVDVKPGIGSGGGGLGPGDGDPFKPDGSEDWPPGWSHEDEIRPNKYRIGMWVGLASILMLFMALTSAYIIRQVPAWNNGVHDWVPIQMPPVLWFNTGVLLISSVSIELARRLLKRGEYSGFKRWIGLTSVLGMFFLAGQLAAWRQLRAQGVYISTNPHSSFFYLLTSLHAVHMFGGLIALIYVTVAALRMRISANKRAAVDVTALYWHFMDGLWVYLFVLLFFFQLGA